MYRFFTEQVLSESSIRNSTINIEGEDYNHLKNALRIRIGEDIELTDSLEKTYLGTVETFEKKYCSLKIGKEILSDNEPLFEVTLYMSLLKGDRMDSAIQKSIECGVKRIVPLISRNTIVEISDKNQKSKLERWNKIARHACMQCKRDHLVQVEPVISLKEALELVKMEEDFVSLVCHEKEESYTLKAFMKDNTKKKINIFIGPEGGFSDQEIEIFSSSSIKSLSLGKRVLRADTACAAAVFFATAYSDL